MAEFVDSVTVHLKGGDGGNGAHSIRREKYKPLAGPNGGNGGRGGSIILRCSEGTNSLLDFRMLPHRTAENGHHGEGDYKDGQKGDDIVLTVPVGTMVFEAKGEVGKPKHRGELLADLRTPGQTFVAAAGGQGGLGNHALANKAHRAPGFALLGEPGEERDLILELKSIADIALVGYPSAGKSSLVAALSSARPKIADYPFTTLVPNLGVVEAGDVRYTIADVPGLIPGASEGKGLGLQFLRHIERTQVIVHVIDCATYEQDRDPMADYEALEKELAAYDKNLELPIGAIPISQRPRIVVLNKMDVPDAKDLANLVRPDFEKLGLQVYEISTASHEGLKELKFALARQVSKTREIVRKLEVEHEQERVVIKPLEMARNRAKNQVGPAFNVIRHGDPEGNYWFVVKGEKIARMVIQTDFNNNEAVGYLADRLASLGVEDALKAAGAVEGDEVHMGPAGNEVVFNWEPTITAGAEGLDDAPLVSRGDDIRLRDYGYAKRRSNSQRRVDYHEEMDRRAEARAERERERRAGHWSDPSVTDSPEQPNE